MKTIIGRSLIFVLSLTVAPVYADDFQDGVDAYKRKDYKMAFEKFKPLAEQGNAKTQNYLGVMYASGRGVTHNYIEAFKWLRPSAEQGYAEAQNNLGLMYDFGKGVLQDYVQAHKWYNIAGTNGYKKGHKNRDFIEIFMSSGQIAEAQELARKWMEKHK